jgi:DNA-directed RNA polymerase subunit M/transcription elongation factor TFIIS
MKGTQMAQYAAGKEVLNYCSKCKLMLSAKIVSLVSGKPSKVICNTCKTEQKFKPSKPTKRKIAPKTARARAKAKPVSEIWEEKMNTLKTDPIKYSIRTHFKEDDIIDHPKFGQGIVEQCVDGDKINVIFNHEIKTLVHNK